MDACGSGGASPVFLSGRCRDKEITPRALGGEVICQRPDVLEETDGEFPARGWNLVFVANGAVPSKS